MIIAFPVSCSILSFSAMVYAVLSGLSGCFTVAMIYRFIAQRDTAYIVISANPWSWCQCSHIQYKPVTLVAFHCL